VRRFFRIRREHRAMKAVTASISLSNRIAESSHQAFLQRSHFGSLDGLRCLSIIAVIWAHGPGTKAPLLLLRSGGLGVELFFAISGFLITTLLLREREAAGAISLRRFYVRRALRIFPAYYTVLAIYTVLVLLSLRHTAEGQHFLSNLKYFVTYTANWFVLPGEVFGIAWSLASEEQFYCVWPSIEKYVGIRWALLALFAVVTFAISIRSGWLGSQVPHFIRLVGSKISLTICFGVLIAHVLHSRRGYRFMLRALGHPAAGLAVVAVLAAAISCRVPRPITGAGMAILVAACVIREDHWLKPVLSTRPVVFVGKVSYGMYLAHGLAYNVAERLTSLSHHGFGSFGLAFVLTVASAGLSFRYYESFFLRLKKNFAVRSYVANSNPRSRSSDSLTSESTSVPAK
jgi:peptidoglycan/LPS O-acetylase OafA/YrhL